MAKNLKNYTGLKFNYLTAISFHYRLKNKTYWTFNCDCGENCIKVIDKVTSGYSKSCGCKSLRGKVSIKKNTESSFNAVYHRYKTTSKIRGISFDLSKDEFKTITSKNCHYCGVEPLQASKYTNIPKETVIYFYNGIDRMDNKAGYNLENSKPCCFVCNRSKRDMNYADFLAYIQRLKNYN